MAAAMAAGAPAAPAAPAAGGTSYTGLLLGVISTYAGMAGTRISAFLQNMYENPFVFDEILKSSITQSQQVLYNPSPNAKRVPKEIGDEDKVAGFEKTAALVRLLITLKDVQGFFKKTTEQLQAYAGKNRSKRNITVKRLSKELQPVYERGILEAYAIAVITGTRAENARAATQRALSPPLGGGIAARTVSTVTAPVGMFGAMVPVRMLSDLTLQSLKAAVNDTGFDPATTDAERDVNTFKARLLGLLGPGQVNDGSLLINDIENTIAPEHYGAASALMKEITGRPYYFTREARQAAGQEADAAIAARIAADDLAAAAQLAAGEVAPVHARNPWAAMGGVAAAAVDPLAAAGGAGRALGPISGEDESTFVNEIRSYSGLTAAVLQRAFSVLLSRAGAAAVDAAGGVKNYILSVLMGGGLRVFPGDIFQVGERYFTVDDYGTVLATYAPVGDAVTGGAASAAAGGGGAGSGSSGGAASAMGAAADKLTASLMARAAAGETGGRSRSTGPVRSTSRALKESHLEGNSRRPILTGPLNPPSTAANYNSEGGYRRTHRRRSHTHKRKHRAHRVKASRRARRSAAGKSRKAGRR